MTRAPRLSERAISMRETAAEICPERVRKRLDSHQDEKLAI
jgi:hypothetical protein